MYYWQGKKYNRIDLIEFLKSRQLDNIEKWERSLLEFALKWLDENIELFKVKTSGSTATPKWIQLTRNQMIDSAKATRDFLKLKRGDTCLLVLPTDFIAGKMMIVRALEIGMDLYYFPPQVSVLKHIKREFDFAAFIPLQIQFAIDAAKTEKLNLIHKIIIGGASLADKYVDNLRNLKSDFYATYGMTETITHVAIKNLKQKNNYFNALPGITFSSDKNNCLIILSERLPNKRIVTNDLVDLKSYTAFILIGRYDNIINSGGLKIIPEELEERIQQIIAKEVFIGFKNDPDLGQLVVMVMEGMELNEQDIKKQLKLKIPKNKIPREIYGINSFFRTENQKINRKKMQEWILNYQRI